VDPRKQFTRVERLAKVVIGADFQPDDAVHVLAFGGQHDDGRAVVGGAQAAADRQAVLARHHEVEHDQVHRLPQQDAAQRLAILGHHHFEPFLRRGSGEAGPGCARRRRRPGSCRCGGWGQSSWVPAEFVTTAILSDLPRRRPNWVLAFSHCYKYHGAAAALWVKLV
jgi:hypothetical protein